MKRLRMFSAGILILGFIFLAFKLGQFSQPKISFESNYIRSQRSAGDTLFNLDLKTSSSLSYSYIPAYSHVYTAEGSPLEMAITLSLRNIDPKNKVSIKVIQYYNTEGQLIRTYLDSGFDIAPLATKEIFIKKSDVEGGSGANFVVTYQSNPHLLPPIFEAVMATEDQQNSYIFTSRGVIYTDHTPQGT